MTIHYQGHGVTLHHGDCLDVLRTLPDASVDSVVTDPPYGLEFMGKDWDAPWKASSVGRGVRVESERAAEMTERGKGHSTPGGPFLAARVDSTRVAGKPFQDWCEAWATECLRVLKPGGHLLAFGGTRTWHRLACAVEDAGFEVRDSIAWMYGSGFPKSLDVSKAIDKAAGAEREVVGNTSEASGRTVGLGTSAGYHGDITSGHCRDITAPATDAARQWAGFGTALKPAFEPVVVARKPLIGTVSANVLAHGTGALNIDGCRIGLASGEDVAALNARSGGRRGFASEYVGGTDHPLPPGADLSKGRWPANVVLDESQAEALDEQSGETVSNVRTPSGKDDRGVPNTASQMVMRRNDTDPRGVADSGGASRFFPVFKEDDSCTDTTTPAASAPTLTATGAPDATHAPGTTTPSGASSAGDSGATTDLPIELMVERFRYVAKADATERPRVNGTAHPTVKPLSLMRWLVRLVTPPGGTVLEPFAGSGTTVEACIVEGFQCIAIEKGDEYLPLIMQRIHRRRDPVAAIRQTGDELGLFELDGEGA